MQINSSDRLLELVLRSLDGAIAPELQSPGARGAVELIRSTLGELRRRLGPSAELLARCIESGEVLARELAAALGEALATPAEVGAHETFESLSPRYSALTQRIDAACQRLAAQEHPQAAALLRRAAEWELGYYAGVQQLAPPPVSEMPQTAPPLSAAFLQDFLNEVRDAANGPYRVAEFAPLPGGFGKQTYLCSVDDAKGAREELVVRKSDPAPIMSHGIFELEQEFALLRDLNASGYPAPRPLELASKRPGVDATFYTMPRLPGRVPGSFLGAHQQTFSEALLLRLAELLAELHRVPLTRFANYFAQFEDAGALSETIEQRYRRNLRGWRAYVAGEPHLASPYITWLFDWLEHHVPADSRAPVLTHGDFNVHNVLAEGDRIIAVLDWECADFGAPELDLAYIQPHVSKHIAWERFVARYREHGGPEIDSTRMPFCLAYSVLRTSLGGNRGTRNLQTGKNPDLRYVMAELGFVPMFMQIALDNAR